MSAGSSVPFHVFVFSFNRGELLANCIESVERCAPWARLTIVDDDSDDPATRAVLADLATRHRVRAPADWAEDGPAGVHNHGGLYPNMQAAFAHLEDDEVFCFLQDDMQLVRRLDPAEIPHFHRLVAGPDGPRFAHPPFMKGSNRRTNASLIRFDAALDTYFVDRFHRSAGAHFSAVCLGHAGALRRVGWNFIPRESANERQARTSLGQMAYLRCPFVAWLPNVPAYRGRMRTLALRLAERRHASGFHPLETMDEPQRVAFLERDPAILPWAEDFLQTRDAPVAQPWIYYPLQGVRTLKYLNGAEVKLRRFAARLSGRS